MKLAELFLAFFVGVSFAGNIPLVHVAQTCTAGYMSGKDVAQYTVPYTYSEVLTIIGKFKNLTWAGNPPNTVTLNGTDNKVGTARMYDIAPGATLIETIGTYEKPKNGPYIEIHTTAPFTFMGLKLYIPADAQNISEVCGGKATNFNFTADFCANNVTAAKGLLHTAHYQSAVEVGKLLGGKKFTSCSALNKMSSSSGGGGGGGGSGDAHPSAKAFSVGLSVFAAAFVAALLVL